MKWIALVVMGWLLMGVVASADKFQPSGRAAHHSMDAPADATTTSPVAAVVDGGDQGCWEDYVDRAIEIYRNLLECVGGNEWYDAFGYLICELSYEFGAFMAFMRLIACINT